MQPLHKRQQTFGTHLHKACLRLSPKQSTIISFINQQVRMCITTMKCKTYSNMMKQVKKCLIKQTHNSIFEKLSIPTLCTVMETDFSHCFLLHIHICDKNYMWHIQIIWYNFAAVLLTNYHKYLLEAILSTVLVGKITNGSIACIHYANISVFAFGNLQKAKLAVIQNCNHFLKLYYQTLTTNIYYV